MITVEDIEDRDRRSALVMRAREISNAAALLKAIDAHRSDEAFIRREIEAAGIRSFGLENVEDLYFKLLERTFDQYQAELTRTDGPFDLDVFFGLLGVPVDAVLGAFLVASVPMPPAFSDFEAPQAIQMVATELLLIEKEIGSEPLIGMPLPELQAVVLERLMPKVPEAFRNAYYADTGAWNVVNFVLDLRAKGAIKVTTSHIYFKMFPEYLGEKGALEAGQKLPKKLLRGASLARKRGLFRHGSAPVPINPVTWALSMATGQAGAKILSSQNAWTEGDDGIPKWEHCGEGSLIVYPKPSVSDGAPTPTAKELWALLQTYNTLTLDTMLAICVELGRTRDGHHISVPISSILQSMGWNRYGKDREAISQKIRDEVQRLGSLRVDVVWPRKGGRIRLEGDRLFEIVEVIEELPGDGRLFRRGWMIRPGLWGQYWLSERSQVRIRQLSKAILDLDHRDVRGVEALAKKIAVRAVLFLPSNPARMLYENLLADIGELPKEPDKKWGGRIRHRVEKALLLLKERGIAEITWPKRFAPGERFSNKSWLDGWLKSEVALTDLGVPLKQMTNPHAPANISAGRVKGPKLTQLDRPGTEHLKQVRESLGMHQGELAQALGITQPHLSRVESGARRLSAGPAAKLAAILKQKARKKKA